MAAVFPNEPRADSIAACLRSLSFLRQAQRRIRRVHVRRPRRPVRHPGHGDLPEHRRQRPGVTGLRAGPGHAVSAGHLLLALLAGRPQVQVILVHPPQQLPAAASAAPPAPRASGPRPPGRTATPLSLRKTPWTAQTAPRPAPAHTLASGSFLPFWSSNNQERNGKEPLHAHRHGHLTPDNPEPGQLALTSKEPHPSLTAPDKPERPPGVYCAVQLSLSVYAFRSFGRGRGPLLAASRCDRVPSPGGIRAGGPVTNQVTTGSDGFRRGRAQPEKPIRITCRYPTQRYTPGLNWPAWHARGQGFESP